jgi:(S)-sulfolactate dehydrogenase
LKGLRAAKGTGRAGQTVAHGFPHLLSYRPAVRAKPPNNAYMGPRGRTTDEVVMADIVITEFMDDEAVRCLAGEFDVHFDPTLCERQEELASCIGKARALIVRNRTRVNGEILSAGNHLKCIGRLGVGLDNIDMETCGQRGIKVYPATGANNLAVAEYVICSAMLLLRRAFMASDAVSAGHWPREQLIGCELAGKTLGLVGYGSIAHEVAWRAHMLGMQIVANDPFLAADHPAWQIARNVSLDAVFELCDVVSVHVPLTQATKGMVDAAMIGRMKPGAVIINAARGGVVEEAALAAALERKAIGGAAIDVFAHEPLDAEAGARFAGLSNVLLTPHIAGLTQESNMRVSDMIADKITRHLKGTA